MKLAGARLHVTRAYAAHARHRGTAPDRRQHPAPACPYPQLEGLERVRRLSQFDAREIEDELRVRLQDLQGLLGRHVAHSRRILRSLLVGRLAFTPRADDRGRYYEFTGQGALGRLLAGLANTKGLVAPTGRDQTYRIQVRDFIAR